MSARVESRAVDAFADVLAAPRLAERLPRRLEIDPERVRSGLGQLVLTLVKLLHEVLERQALRRIEGGGLTDPEIERLGLTLMRQAEEIGRLRDAFGLEDKDLEIDLGPLGKLVR